MSAVPEDDVLLGLIRGSLDHCVKCTICETHCPYSNATLALPGAEVRRPAGRAVPHRRGGHARTPRSTTARAAASARRSARRACTSRRSTPARKAKLAEAEGVPLRNQLLGRPDVLGRARHAGRAPRELDAGQQAAAGARAEAPGHPQGRRAARSSPGRRSSAGRKRHAAPAGGDEGGRLLPRLRHELLRARPRREDRRDPRAQRLQGRRSPSRAAAGCRCSPTASSRPRRAYSKRLAKHLAPHAREGKTIVGIATSCTLMVKREAREILGLDEDPDVRVVSEHTFDICEFLLDLHDRGELRTDFQPVEETVAYHAPCQQQGHNIGKPALDLFALVPGLETVEMHSHCCGIAGTYGLKEEKRQISLDVGADLFAQVREADPTIVACDSETCRWHIEKETGVTDRPPRRDPPPRLRAVAAWSRIVVVSHSAALAASVIELREGHGRRQGAPGARGRRGGRDRDGLRADRRGRRASARGVRRRRRPRPHGPRLAPCMTAQMVARAGRAGRRRACGSSPRRSSRARSRRRSTRGGGGRSTRSPRRRAGRCA